MGRSLLSSIDIREAIADCTQHKEWVIMLNFSQQSIGVFSVLICSYLDHSALDIFICLFQSNCQTALVNNKHPSCKWFFRHRLLPCDRMDSRGDQGPKIPGDVSLQYVKTLSFLVCQIENTTKVLETHQEMQCLSLFQATIARSFRVQVFLCVHAIRLRLSTCSQVHQAEGPGHS